MKQHNLHPVYTAAISVVQLPVLLFFFYGLSALPKRFPEISKAITLLQAMHHFYGYLH